MTTAAFFDLDRTLVTVNTANLWLKHAFKTGTIRTRDLIIGLGQVALYHLNLLDSEAAAKRFMRLTAQGHSVAEAERIVRAWYSANVAHLYSRPALDAVEKHRSEGHPLVLLSSTSPFQGKLVVEQLKMHACLSTEFEIEGDNLTGEITQFCHGKNKVFAAERYAEKAGVDLSKSYFYTDSASDLPMLERVGRPVAVNPDPQLKRRAKREGWPIVEWK